MIASVDHDLLAGFLFLNVPLVVVTLNARYMASHLTGPIISRALRWSLL